MTGCFPSFSSLSISVQKKSKILFIQKKQSLQEYQGRIQGFFESDNLNLSKTADTWGKLNKEYDLWASTCREMAQEDQAKSLLKLSREEEVLILEEAKAKCIRACLDQLQEDFQLSFEDNAEFSAIETEETQLHHPPTSKTRFISYPLYLLYAGMRVGALHSLLTLLGAPGLIIYILIGIFVVPFALTGCFELKLNAERTGTKLKHPPLYFRILRHQQRMLAFIEDQLQEQLAQEENLDKEKAELLSNYLDASEKLGDDFSPSQQKQPYSKYNIVLSAEKKAEVLSHMRAYKVFCLSVNVANALFTGYIFLNTVSSLSQISLKILILSIFTCPLAHWWLPVVAVVVLGLLVTGVYLGYKVMDAKCSKMRAILLEFFGVHDIPSRHELEQQDKKRQRILVIQRRSLRPFLDQKSVDSQLSIFTEKHGVDQKDAKNQPSFQIASCRARANSM